MKARIEKFLMGNEDIENNIQDSEEGYIPHENIHDAVPAIISYIYENGKPTSQKNNNSIEPVEINEDNEDNEDLPTYSEVCSKI